MADRSRVHNPTYRPGLDGLRGIAVIAVLLFHSGVSWASGGFLGVSVFFTLSGYLIGSLALAEHAENGRISLRNFWRRRARRLLPAALAAIAFALLLGATVFHDQRQSIAGDALASLFYVANWRFWATGQSYSALFTAPSPLLHFWSLAIEEQFYVVFPLLAMVALRRRRRWTRLFGALWLAGLIASVALAANQTLGYYATFTRSTEILTGVLLAGALRRVALTSGAVRRLDEVAMAAFALLVVLIVVVERTTPWLYRGGFAVISLLSATIIAAAVQAGRTASIFAFAPLRQVGLVSYGLYLYHWPVYLWLTPERLGVSLFWTTLLRWAVTAGITIVSYRFLEQPIRHGRWMARPVAVPVAVAATFAVIAVALPMRRTDSESTRPSFEQLERDLAGALPTVPTSAVSMQPVSTTEAPRPVANESVKIGVFGDSTALVIGDGLRRWGRTGDRAVVGGVAALGCTVLRTGEIDFFVERRGISETCRWEKRWPIFVELVDLDVIVVEFGPWDVSDRLLPGETTPRHLGDPVLDDLFRRDMAEAADLLIGLGKPVAWLTSPLVEFDRGSSPFTPRAASDPARMWRFNELVGEVLASRPAIERIDFAGYLASLPGGELDAGRRPDGVHLTPAAATEVAEWLGPQLERLARRSNSV
jgi:peptidoglycan/LPS O-acetylase OafA/YrhL